MSEGSLSLESSEDRRNLDRFIKFFVLKSAQVILQSRIVNRKVCTLSRLPSLENPSDWFNVCIPEDVTISERTRAALSRSDQKNFTLKIEIRLNDGSASLLLEIWTIKCSFNGGNENNRMVFNVYNKMGIMIKSLLCLTRVTQTYKICRNAVRECDTREVGGYFIDYAVDLVHEAVDLQALLGDKFKQVYLGKVPLWLDDDGIALELSYRTELVTTATVTSSKLFIKSDHYAPEDRPVKPAFDEDWVDQISQDGSDVPLSRLLFKGQGNQINPGLETRSESLKSTISNLESTEVPPQIQPPSNLSLPFAGSDSENSTSENSDLLTLFEEFRVAPGNLASFEGNAGNEFSEESFLDDLILYEDFCKRLCQ